MEDILRDEPIIIFCYNDECLIIDGNHRLLKRKKDGFIECKVIFLDYELIYNFSENF
jgi:hypothetical protein